MLVTPNTDSFCYYPSFVSMTYIFKHLHFSLKILIGITGLNLKNFIHSLSQNILPFSLHHKCAHLTEQPIFHYHNSNIICQVIFYQSLMFSLRMLWIICWSLPFSRIFTLLLIDNLPKALWWVYIPSAIPIETASSPQ